MGGEKTWKPEAIEVFHPDDRPGFPLWYGLFRGPLPRAIWIYKDFSTFLDREQKRYKSRWYIESVQDLGTWNLPEGKKSPGIPLESEEEGLYAGHGLCRGEEIHRLVRYDQPFSG